MLRLVFLLLIFLSATVGLYAVWNFGPTIATDSTVSSYDGSHFPLSFVRLKLAAQYFSSYRDQHFGYVLFLFTLAYLYKQCFAIPGSFFMNLLAGALFGRWRAVLLVCPLTTIGASGCYLLSSVFAKPLVDRFCMKHVQTLRLQVIKNQDRLMYFLVGARIFPLTPHWLLNISSPFLRIPLTKFALSVFIGLIPYNLICVQAGGILSEIHNPSEVFNLRTNLELIGIAFAVIGFGFFIKKKNPDHESGKTDKIA